MYLSELRLIDVRANRLRAQFVFLYTVPSHLLTFFQFECLAWLIGTLDFRIVRCRFLCVLTPVCDAAYDRAIIENRLDPSMPYLS